MSNMNLDVEAFKNSSFIPKQKEKYSVIKFASWFYVVLGILLCGGVIYLGFINEKENFVNIEYSRYIGIGLGVIILFNFVIMSQFMSMLLDVQKSIERESEMIGRTNRLINSYINGEILLSPRSNSNQSNYYQNQQQAYQYQQQANQVNQLSDM